MLKIDGAALFEAVNQLSEMEKIAFQDADWVYKNPEKLRYMRDHVNALINQLKILDTRLAIKKAEQILISLADNLTYDPKIVASLVSKRLDELRERIEQELQDRAIYFLPPGEADLYNSGIKAFDREIVDRFGDLSTDLGEAVYCLSLSRTTASVFHLMRAMEGAVQEIGAKLGVTVIDKNNVDLEWGKIIANVKTAVEAMPKGDARDEWSEIVTLLYHVKQCWRNSTMHPKQTYLPTEADEVFRSVRGFLRRLVRLV